MAKKARTAVVPQPQRYVILPPRGLRSTAGRMGTVLSRSLELMVPNAPLSASNASLMGLSKSVKAGLHVVDSIHENGAKLVEISPEALLELRAAQPGLRIVPEVFYHQMAFIPEILKRAKKPKESTGLNMEAGIPPLVPKIVVTIRSATDKQPIKGLKLIAFTDFQERKGLDGITNKAGQVALDFGLSSVKLDCLYVMGNDDHWGAYREKFTIKNGALIELDPIDLSFDDCVRKIYGRASLDTGQGVKVGVIDSGIDPNHPDLRVEGGYNLVTGADPGDYGDNGGRHGTHVGGIIAARGKLPGVAPGVTLRSYRVFDKYQPKGDNGASNFAIAKAIDQAVTDGCDLINMSLGGGDVDDAIRSAIADAREGGTLVIVASGNDGRQQVSFPANDPRAIAVSALGIIGTYPESAAPQGDAKPPFGTGKNKSAFVAAFSNIGPEIDVIGPGVGVVSTVPTGYTAMSGTSMACPAITGATARLLAANPTVLRMPRDESRSDEIAKLLFTAAKSLGFGSNFEGQGLPQ